MRTSIRVVLVATAALAAAASGPAQQPAAAPATVPAPAAAPATAPAPAYYRIELAPTGSYVAIGAPVAKGTTLVFKALPNGNVMSLRKSDVKKISPITAQEAAAPTRRDPVAIGNLAMQGGSAPGGGGGARGSAAHAAASSSGGPAVVSTRDGIAITTGSTAAASSVAGPAVTSTHDGMIVTAQPPY